VIADEICIMIYMFYLKRIIYAQHDTFLLYFRHAHTWCIVYETNINVTDSFYNSDMGCSFITAVVVLFLLLNIYINT